MNLLTLSRLLRKCMKLRNFLYLPISHHLFILTQWTIPFLKAYYQSFQKIYDVWYLFLVSLNKLALINMNNQKITIEIGNKSPYMGTIAPPENFQKQKVSRWYGELPQKISLKLNKGKGSIFQFKHVLTQL